MSRCGDSSRLGPALPGRSDTRPYGFQQSFLALRPLLNVCQPILQKQLADWVCQFTALSHIRW